MTSFKTQKKKLAQAAAMDKSKEDMGEEKKISSIPASYITPL